MSLCSLYWGFQVIVVGLLGALGTGPGQASALGTTTTSLVKELKLTRRTVSNCWLFSTIVSAFLLPYLGKFLDRFGPRISFVLMTFGSGCACWFYTTIGDINGTEYNSMLLLPGYWGLRFFANGGLWIVSVNAINMWWVRKRSLVQSYCTPIISFFIYIFASYSEYRVKKLGWRAAYQEFAYFELLFVLPIGFVFMRNRPEVYGMRPDNVDGNNVTATPSVGNPHYTVNGQIDNSKSDNSPVEAKDGRKPTKKDDLAFIIPERPGLIHVSSTALLVPTGCGLSEGTMVMPNVLGKVGERNKRKKGYYEKVDSKKEPYSPDEFDEEPYSPDEFDEDGDHIDGTTSVQENVGDNIRRSSDTGSTPASPSPIGNGQFEFPQNDPSTEVQHSKDPTSEERKKSKELKETEISLYLRKSQTNFVGLNQSESSVRSVSQIQQGSSRSSERSNSKSKLEVNYTLAEARRTRHFWIYVGTNMVIGITCSAFVIHLDRILLEFKSELVYFYIITALSAMLTSYLSLQGLSKGQEDAKEGGSEMISCTATSTANNRSSTSLIAPPAKNNLFYRLYQLLLRKWCSCERVSLWACLCQGLCCVTCSFGLYIYHFTSIIGGNEHGNVNNNVATTEKESSFHTAVNTQEISASGASATAAPGITNPQLDDSVLHGSPPSDFPFHPDSIANANTERHHFDIGGLRRLSEALMGFYTGGYYLYAEVDYDYYHTGDHAPILTFIRRLHNNETRNLETSALFANLIFYWVLLLGVLQGCSIGFTNTIQNLAYALAFGRTHNGSIQGFAKSLMVLGSAVGPLILSLLYRYFRSFFIDALLILSVLSWIVATAAWMTPDRDYQPTSKTNSPATSPTDENDRNAAKE